MPKRAAEPAPRRTELSEPGREARFLFGLAPERPASSIEPTSRHSRPPGHRRAQHRGSQQRAGPALIAIEEVSKRFGGIVAVDRCSLRIETGTVTGLIGPNGAGKTTLFNIVAGFMAPTGGRILLDGRDVTGLAPAPSVPSGLGPHLPDSARVRADDHAREPDGRAARPGRREPRQRLVPPVPRCGARARGARPRRGGARVPQAR